VHATKPYGCARAQSAFAQHTSRGLILLPSTNALGMQARYCQHINSPPRFCLRSLALPRQTLLGESNVPKDALYIH
jgi:hypothetical protein